MVLGSPSDFKDSVIFKGTWKLMPIFLGLTHLRKEFLCVPVINRVGADNQIIIVIIYIFLVTLQPLYNDVRDIIQNYSSSPNGLCDSEAMRARGIIVLVKSN